MKFDRRLKLDYRSPKVTSDAGLLPCRELDEKLGLTAMTEEVLHDTHTEGFNHSVASTVVPIAAGWSNSCWVGLTPTQEQRVSWRTEELYDAYWQRQDENWYHADTVGRVQSPSGSAKPSAAQREGTCSLHRNGTLAWREPADTNTAITQAIEESR